MSAPTSHWSFIIVFAILSISFSPQNIYRFLKRFFDSGLAIKTPCVIISLIYIRRLLKARRKLLLSSQNWIPVVCISLLTASKMWDDAGHWNSEFARVYPIFRLQQLNRLEVAFHMALDYDFLISRSIYTQVIEC